MTTTTRMWAWARAHLMGLPLARVMGLYNASTRYGGDWQKAYIDVTTDLHFYCDSRTVLDATSKQGVPAWGYRLDHAPFFMRLDDCLGVPHTSDLFFLFGNFDSLLDPDEVALGRRMRQYWKRFAVDPQRLGGSWPQYGGMAARQYLALGALDAVEDAVEEQWKREACDAIGDIRKRGYL